MVRWPLLRALWALTCILAFAACSGNGAGPADGTCISKSDCDVGEACVSGQCLASNPRCDGDEDCPSDQTCNTDTGACEVPPAPMRCTDDTMCPSDQRCNTLTGVCFDAPRTCTPGGTDCAEGHCDATTQTCVACLETIHCTGEDVCENNECVDPEKPPEMMDDCTDDTMCQAPITICENMMCVLGCAQVGGLMCDTDSVCDSNTGRCVVVAGPCTDDNMCNPPMTVCESQQCIPGCAQQGGLQCQGGTVCNEATGRCQGGGPICTDDGDCGPPATVCNLFAGVCEDGCSITGCTAPEVCDTATGHCRDNTPCMADRLEPNQSQQMAAGINQGLQTNLTACPGDDDWYSAPVTAGDDITVTLNFVHGEGDLNLELYDPSGGLVGSSNGVTGTEVVTFTAMVSGVHAVRITMAQDTGPRLGNTYSLDIRAQVAACNADRFEPNNTENDASLAFPGALSSLNVCTGDDDFYDYLLASGDTITVTATFDASEGNIDIELIRLFGIPIASSRGSSGTETFSYTAQSFGFFTVRAFLQQDAGTVLGNGYSLDVQVSGTPPMMTMCTADAAEENDTAATASPLSVGTTSNLSVCTGDDDFYGIPLTAGDDLTATLSFVDGEGDIDVSLADPSGTVVTTAASSTDNETITHTAATSGTYIMRAYLYGDAGSNPGNTYSVNLGVSGSTPTTCAPDGLEPNNTIGAPASISSGVISNLTACTGDEDFYEISLAAGVPVTVTTNFSNAEGDIDIGLYDAGQTLVTSSAGTVDNESFTYTPTAGGLYTIRVLLYGDAGTVPGNTYQLSITP